MVGGFKEAAQKAWHKLSGREAKERAEARAQQLAAAKQILQDHEARDHFAPEEALDRLTQLLGDAEGIEVFGKYVSKKVEAIVNEALADNILDPEEDARIARVLERYGNPEIDRKSKAVMDRARKLHHALTADFPVVSTPLLLRKGEYCVFGVEAEAAKERSRTVRVNYGGPTARVRIMKGVYYSMGSVNVSREREEYMHSFGHGVLAATNKRLLWMSPSKTVSIALTKIVMFEPFSDGVKIHKETGKPIVFSWPNDQGIGSVWVGRAIEELRHS